MNFLMQFLEAFCFFFSRVITCLKENMVISSNQNRFIIQMKVRIFFTVRYATYNEPLNKKRITVDTRLYV